MSTFWVSVLMVRGAELRLVLQGLLLWQGFLLVLAKDSEARRVLDCSAFF